jgi:hypothetical protein
VDNGAEFLTATLNPSFTTEENERSFLTTKHTKHTKPVRRKKAQNAQNFVTLVPLCG